MSRNKTNNQDSNEQFAADLDWKQGQNSVSVQDTGTRNVVFIIKMLPQ